MSARTIQFNKRDSANQQTSSLKPVECLQPPGPVFPEGALYGVAGEIIRKLEPYSEADPAALYFQLLTCIGSMVGNHAHFEVEGDRHAVNLFLVVVGKSAKARKGTSWGRIFSLLSDVDSRWWADRQASGLSSGEGLIFQVRDESADKKGDAIDGIADKRLLVFEGEFAQVLRVLKREGNTLSGVIRNAWDGKVLAILTKNTPIKATGAHISIVAHVTNEELQKEIRETAEMFNGFANRFLWCFAKRSKLIPLAVCFRIFENKPTNPAGRTLALEAISCLPRTETFPVSDFHRCLPMNGTQTYPTQKMLLLSRRLGRLSG
jgi:hypothetical protein